MTAAAAEARAKAAAMVAVTAVALVSMALRAMLVVPADIRSAKQDNIYGASNIVLPCPGS
jgi:hypothetical protein